MVTVLREFPRRITRWMERREAWLWVILVSIILIGGITLSCRFWVQLHGTQDSVSTTIRNIGLVVGGAVAILLAIWRSRVAERQATTAQRTLLNERYQRGAEMLGSDVLSVRLGGVYALQRLAEEQPDQYHIEIMKLFGAFVRAPTFDGTTHPTEHPPREIRQDVQAIMTAIGSRSRTGLSIEQKLDFSVDLHGADISRAYLCETNLKCATLIGTNLAHATLTGADLSDSNLTFGDLHGAECLGAQITNARMSEANLREANLAMADLTGSNLSGADLSDATMPGTKLLRVDLSSAIIGLGTRVTQQQLDQAGAYPGSPPKIAEGTLDPATKEPLEWRSKLTFDFF